MNNWANPGPGTVSCLIRTLEFITQAVLSVFKGLTIWQYSSLEITFHNRLSSENRVLSKSCPYPVSWGHSPLFLFCQIPIQNPTKRWIFLQNKLGMCYMSNGMISEDKHTGHKRILHSRTIIKQLLYMGKIDLSPPSHRQNVSMIILFSSISMFYVPLVGMMLYKDLFFSCMYVCLSVYENVHMRTGSL